MIELEPLPNLVVSEDLHLAATLLAVAVWCGVFVGAVRLARRYASGVPFVMLAGGGITYLYEPIVDTLGQCYLPETHQWTLFTLLDRDMPVYGLFVYSAFFGGFAMMSWAHLKAGGAASGLWKKYALGIFINAFLFESPAVWADVYTYYGQQPWDLWGFPLWWPFVNVAGPLAAGALAYVLEDRVRIERRLLYAAAFLSEPVFDGFSNGAAAMPTWVVLNSNVPTLVIWLGGTVTIALGCLFVFAATRAVEWARSATVTSAGATSTEARSHAGRARLAAHVG